MKSRVRFRFQAWPLWQRVWFFGILGAFWVSGAVFSYNHGNQPYFHTDSSTEGMSIFAANHYLDHGFFENDLLPTYPPFGHGPDHKQRTEPFVYNHYLAGPDLTLALFMKVFGRDALWAGRLIPHTLTVVAMAWLCLEFGFFVVGAAGALAGAAGIMSCILLSLLMIPRSLTAWSICLYGHSYVMAFYLFLVAGMLWLVNHPKCSGSKAWGLGLSVGLLQMAFDIDWVPLTFICAVGFAVLLTRLPWVQSRRVLLGMLLGGTAALVYQIFISSLYFGSPTWVIRNLADWVSFRAGAEVVDGVTQGDLRVGRILQEYNRQAYGATGFTALNLVALCATFLILGYLGKARDRLATLRGFAGLALVYLAAITWNLAMRQHSVAHIHFLPRHYFVLYMAFMLIALPISYDLVMRSRKC